MPFLVTKEVLETYAGNSDGMIDDLLVLLRKLSAETARESSRAKAIEISEREKQPAVALPAPDEVDQVQEHAIENNAVAVDPAPISVSANSKEVPKIRAAIDPSALIDMEPSLVSANLDTSESLLYVPSVKAA